MNFKYKAYCRNDARHHSIHHHSFYRNFKSKISLSPINVSQLLIITWSLLSVVTSYEIWSIYFDDTLPDLVSVDQQTRQQLFDVPFTRVRHIFEISTYINDTNQNNIRRMELTICDQSSHKNSAHLPQGSFFQNLFNSNATFSCLQKIATEIFPTVPNQTVVKYPPDVGFRINANGEQKFMLTIEYDQDYRLLNDNSGFDLYISDEPLSIEAGVMAVGSVPDFRFLLPPNVMEWNTKGTCQSSCFYYKMDTDHLQIVAMFPSTNHRYLDELVVEIGSSTTSDNKSVMTQKIFAWGGDSSVDITELPIFRVETDKINVRCRYSTGPNSTLGGLADENENCLIWMHYYPKVDLTACMSSYSSATIMSLLDADEVSTTLTPDAGLNFMINGQPLEKFIADKDQHQRWNYRKLARSRYSAENGRQRPQCSWSESEQFQQLRRRRRRRRRR